MSKYWRPNSWRILTQNTVEINCPHKLMTLMQHNQTCKVIGLFTALYKQFLFSADACLTSEYQIIWPTSQLCQQHHLMKTAELHTVCLPAVRYPLRLVLHRVVVFRSVKARLPILTAVRCTHLIRVCPVRAAHVEPGRRDI